jgi:ornithine--oxo-acid transaminase
MGSDTIQNTADDPAIQQELQHGARNYAPLPVVIAEAEGSWVQDSSGRRYFDALSAYSALNFGHRHPRLVDAAVRQLGRLTLTSRAFHNDQLGPFCEELSAFTGKQRILPMNTGAEAVETAIKAARKWGYEAKGVAPGRAKVIACQGNFHGRTTTIVSFSDDPVAREGYAPYTPGFELVPYGDADALRAAIDDDTVAFLVEPIQGEAGVVVPPAGYLRAVREICSEAGVLFVADEIQSGLGRTGRAFATDWEDVTPDVRVLGKALGGGIVALSAIAADDEVLGLFRPGQHGSTFGGNPLACAVGREVLALLADGTLADGANVLGERFAEGVRAAGHGVVRTVRQRGLWVAIELHADAPPARAACEALMALGVLAKDTHETTIRIAPPLTSTAEDLDWALERVDQALAQLA